MKSLIKAFVAIEFAILGFPFLAAPAAAHSVGEKCYFQRIDENGIVRNRFDRCHHLPSRFRERPQSGFSLFFDFGNGWYYGNRPGGIGSGGNRNGVCLVTFFKRSQAEAGADVNVKRARYLSLREAQRIDGPNDRNRIFDYGSNKTTRATCRTLNNINN